MRSLRRFLIINSNGDCRVVQRQPRLRLDEVAYRINIQMPDAWGRIKGDIDVTMPEPPPAILEEQL